MMHFTDITGLAGVALAIVTFTLRLPFFARLHLKLKMGLAVALLVALAIPFGGLSAVEFMRGITGDLSVTTLVLLTLFLILPRPTSGGRADMGAETLLYHRANPTLYRPPAKGKLLTLIVIAAFALYPFALGLGTYDPYRLGFGSLWFISGLLILALAAWLQQYTLIALSLALAVLAWSVGWYESNNLWNYLIDPWVSVYAIFALLKRSVGRMAGTRSR
jgi:hypothetical protein